MSVCLIVCLSNCLFVQLSVCPIVCLSNFLIVCLSNCLFVCLIVFVSHCGTRETVRLALAGEGFGRPGGGGPTA